MGIGAALLFFAAGAILYWAVEVDLPYVDDDALGAILLLAGALALAVTVLVNARRAQTGTSVGSGVGLIAAGAILYWAVDLDLPFVSDGALGVILMIAGLIAVLATVTMQLQSSRSHQVRAIHAPPTVATLTSVGWVQQQDGWLLAVRSRGRDKFYLPGGKPEPGESFDQALMREVREELGLVLSDLQPAFTVQAPADGLSPATNVTMHCYYAIADGQPQPSMEVEEVAWLDIRGDHRAAPAVRSVFERIESRPPSRRG